MPKSLTHIETKPPKIINNLMIFIHGYGSSGHDLITLSHHFQRHLNNCHFISPHAPYKISSMENAYFWFPIDTFDENHLQEGVNQTIPILDKFIKLIIAKYNIQYRQIILCGFSQGTLLAIHYGLTLKTQLKAIIGFSGGALPSLKHQINNNTPICLIHGQDDQVLPCLYSEKTAKILTEQQHPHNIKIIPGLEHSINNQGLEYAIKFIQQL